MDYEVMWNELKEFINNKYENEHDDIPQYIYEGIQDKMNDMESTYNDITKHGDYTCIKDYNWVFTEGTECSILSETEDCYVVETCNGLLDHIDKDKFDECFKLIK
ncbi:hypothetical protein FDJ70_05795 [Clostridium botulinum]|nr:hypothetical protein [Clostridium botulinum]